MGPWIRSRLSPAILTLVLSFLSAPVVAAMKTIDLQPLFAAAAAEGRLGIARKTKTVDAKPAVPGEIIVTVIAGEGVETQSKPAAPGDMVVRNRCPETGNEQFLVKQADFAKRYGPPLAPADGDGWQPFRPAGVELLYMIVRPEDGSFTFTAPWGEAMLAHPGDALVRDPANARDTYRVAAASFACTYEVLKPAVPY